MIILHGYLLEGSGSNLWTRAILRALCKNGHTIHLMCQENHPEIYDFISTVYKYHKNNKIQKTLERKVPYSGECIMHKPILGDTLPVYVWDKYEEFKNPIPMVELDDNEILRYLKFNIDVLSYIVKKYDISSIYANHAVLMSVVAQKVANKNKINYFIMPHGSAIEYAVKKQERFYNFAKEAFDEAKKIFVVGEEMKERIKSLFLGDIYLDNKMQTLNLGVDTSLFYLRENKTNLLQKLAESLPNEENGNSAKFTKGMIAKLHSDLTKEELIAIIKKYNIYNPKSVDLDVMHKLKTLNLEQDKIIITIGRFIENKGMHTIIASLPFILKQQPNTKVILVGHGPLREVIEVVLFALRGGDRKLFENIIEWGSELELMGGGKYEELQEFYNQLKIIDIVDEYFENAQKYIKEDTVIFTGYLTHNCLQYLFPCANVGVFPSLIKEAGPLVFLEAMACGCYPIGTYMGGMEHMINEASELMKGEDGEWMKIKPKKESVVSDLIRNIPKAMELSSRYKNQLNRLIKEKYDWNIVAKELYDSLNQKEFIEVN